MGANNPAREGKSNANRNAKEGNDRYERFGRPHQERCSISGECVQLIADAVDAVAQAGDLLSFGATSDGGAWVVSVFSNGRRYPQYAHTTEELAYALREILDTAR